MRVWPRDSLSCARFSFFALLRAVGRIARRCLQWVVVAAIQEWRSWEEVPPFRSPPVTAGRHRRHRSVRTGAPTEGRPAQGLSRGRSAPSAVSRSHAMGTQWEILVSYSLGPPTEEASLLLEHSNIRFASSLFEPQSYFLFGPVGTLSRASPAAWRRRLPQVTEGGACGGGGGNGGVDEPVQSTQIANGNLGRLGRRRHGPPDGDATTLPRPRDLQTMLSIKH